MGVAIAYNPCGWCPYKESGERCGMCELTFRRKEWISVDERLPATDNKNTYDFNVLVFISKREGCRQHGIFLGKLKHSEAEDGSKNFWNIPIEESEWTVWGWSYFEHPVVTHWMPLPEAPKMKGGAE